MRVTALNPAGSSGFLIQDAGRQILVDMGTPSREPFLDASRRAGLQPEEVRMVAFTHIHRDHTDVDGISLLLERSDCPFLIPRICWETPGPHRNALKPVAVELVSSGRLRLIGSKGSDVFGGVRVSWGPLAHQVVQKTIPGGSIAFRIRDVLVGADGPVDDLFSPANTHLRDTKAESGPVRTLVISLTHESPAEVEARDNLTNARKARYLTGHGLVNDLLRVMRRPEDRPFFDALRMLIPTHIRQEPGDECARRFLALIDSERARLSFDFRTSLQP